MISPQWLELPMSRTNFHGPKDVRAIEVRLYLNFGCFFAKEVLYVYFPAHKFPSENNHSESNVFATFLVTVDPYSEGK